MHHSMSRFILVASLGLWSINSLAAGVSFVWSSTTGTGTTGGNTIAAAAGDQLTLNVMLDADAVGISSYGVSLSFDGDLGDELDIVSVNELLPADFAFHLSQGVDGATESTTTTVGAIGSFEGGTFASGAVSKSVLIGQVVFAVTGTVATDGADVFAMLRPGFDGVFDSLGDDLSGAVLLGQASVNAPVPVPPALGLFALACVTLLGRMRNKRVISNGAG